MLPGDILRRVAPLCEQKDLARLHCVTKGYHQALPAAVLPLVAYHDTMKALYDKYYPSRVGGFNFNFNVLRIHSGMGGYRNYL